MSERMFTVIYLFKVKPDHAQTFERTWREMTILISQYEGSLGSRLHKQNELDYIAYAQWPDESTFRNSGSKLPEVFYSIRKTMKECCEEIKPLFELEVVEDLLIK